MDARRYKKPNRREENIQVVLNIEEKKIIVDQAKAEGLPVSTYIRWKLMRK